MTPSIRSPWWPEVVVLLGISITLAWVVNVSRPEPLPWLGDYTARKMQEAAKGGVQALTVAQAREAWESGARAFIDARDPMEFEQEHIPGAVNIPVDAVMDGSIEKLAASFAKDRPLLFYCGNLACPKSKELAQAFKDLGYTALAVMPEGLDGWKAAGGRMEGK